MKSRVGSNVRCPLVSILSYGDPGCRRAGSPTPRNCGPGGAALGQATWLAVVDPGPIPAVLTSHGLGAGETAVLAHALANPGSGVIFDDQAARTTAAAFGIPHLGTLGLLIFAKRTA